MKAFYPKQSRPIKPPGKGSESIELKRIRRTKEYDDSINGIQLAVERCFQIQPERQLAYDDMKGKRTEEEFKAHDCQTISNEVDVKLKKKYSMVPFENALSEAIASK